MNVTEFSLDVGGGRSLDVRVAGPEDGVVAGRAPRHAVHGPAVPPVRGGGRGARAPARDVHPPRIRGVHAQPRPLRRRLRGRYRARRRSSGRRALLHDGAIGRGTACARVRGAAPGPSHRVRHDSGRRAIRRGRARLPGRHGAGEHRRAGRGRRKRGSIGGVPPDRCREAPEAPRRRISRRPSAASYRRSTSRRSRASSPSTRWRWCTSRSRPASGDGSTTTSRSCIRGGSISPTIRVPVTVWQGAQDRMVPFAHGEWLAAHVPGAKARLFDDEGHLSLSSARSPRSSTT